MVEFNELVAEVNELKRLLTVKNEIIQHLKQRLTNQQKQIQLLINDSEEKHLHQISKHTKHLYERNLWENRYLLLKVKDDHPSIFLSKNIEIVPFEELKYAMVPSQNSKSSGKLEDSCHVLSDQLSQLKQKLEVYSKLVNGGQERKEVERQLKDEEKMDNFEEKGKGKNRKIKTIYLRK